MSRAHPRSPLSWLPLLLACLLALGLWLRSQLLTRRVGYEGPLPSVEARASLNELLGRTLPAGSVGFTSAELLLRSFLVTPLFPAVIAVEPGRATQPANALPREGSVGTFWIPTLTDGDIADLRRRAGLAVPEWMEVSMSAEYTRYMTGR